MKNFFKMLLACVSFVLVFSSCSKDDENNVKLTPEEVVGTWNIVWAELDGESIDNIPEGTIQAIFKSDGTYRVTLFADSYTGKYKIDGNTIIGTTLDPITEYFKFTSIDGNKANIDYSNSDGDKYKFRAIKK